jgi:predicted regulator of Ras-like GTPase activity (Roadblock/LC7/MglB family)
MADGLDRMARGPETPDAEIHRCLDRLASLPGMRLAALVDAEGFVVASAGDPAGDPEGPAAVSSWLVDALGGSGDLLGMGALRTVMVEHGDGAMLVRPLGPAGVLALVSRDAAALGGARRDLDEVLPALGQTL